MSAAWHNSLAKRTYRWLPCPAWWQNAGVGTDHRSGRHDAVLGGLAPHSRGPRRPSGVAKRCAIPHLRECFPPGRWLAGTQRNDCRRSGVPQADQCNWVELLAASAGMYLSGMDILFDLENGIYPLITQASQTGAVLTEIGINVATLGISLFTLQWAMRHQQWDR